MSLGWAKRFRDYFFPRDRKSKKRTNIHYVRPSYFLRHLDRDFLILATGPSLGTYREKIQDFAKKHNLVVIGVNNSSSIIKTDYLGFSNRARFMQYAGAVKSTKGLLSIFFADHFIEEFWSEPFEFIMWKDTGNSSDINLDIQGIITHTGTSSTLMMMVAYAMGARQIYVAGMDGYNIRLKGGKDHHFEKNEYKKRLSEEEFDKKISHWQGVQHSTLDHIQRWAAKNGRLGFKFLTPSDHSDHFDKKLLNI